jgi:hypothetical protein
VYLWGMVERTRSVARDRDVSALCDISVSTKWPPDREWAVTLRSICISAETQVIGRFDVEVLALATRAAFQPVDPRDSCSMCRLTWEARQRLQEVLVNVLHTAHDHHTIPPKGRGSARVPMRSYQTRQLAGLWAPARLLRVLVTVLSVNGPDVTAPATHAATRPGESCKSGALIPSHGDPSVEQHM